MRHTTLLLLVTFLPTPVRADGPPPSKGDAGYAVPLHKLTTAEASRLDGQRGLFYVRVESWGQLNGKPFCGCETPRGVWAGAWMRPGQGFAKTMVVEATLRAYFWPGNPPRVQYHLEDAVRR